MKVADLAELGNLKEKFDLIFCRGNFASYPFRQIKTADFNEYKKLLKPDGKLLMTNRNLWRSKYLKYIIKYTLLKLTDPQGSRLLIKLKPRIWIFKKYLCNFSKKISALYYAFTERNIARLLKKTGFKVIKNLYTRNIITVAKIKSER